MITAWACSPAAEAETSSTRVGAQLAASSKVA